MVDNNEVLDMMTVTLVTSDCVTTNYRLTPDLASASLCCHWTVDLINWKFNFYIMSVI